MSSWIVLPLSLFISLVVYISCTEIKISHRAADDDEEQLVVADEATFEADLKNFMENGERSEEFDKVLESLWKNGYERVPKKPQTRAQILSVIRCIGCREIFKYFISRRKLGDCRNNLANSAIRLCIIGTGYSQDVCKGLINLNIDPILFIVDSRPRFNQNSICALLLQKECGELDESLDFNVNIAPQAAKIAPKTSQRSTSHDIKIIQFTDVHFDPLYAVGGDASSNEPLRCRKKAVASDTNGAGYWGDYRKCDMPQHTIEHALRHIASQHPDADFVYYTGDFVPHNIWDTTVRKNIDVMNKMYKLMKDVFGRKTIYPILGNHEAHPVNLFVPSSINDKMFSTQWLYNYSASAWRSWLPPETAKTILKGGYYTLLIKPGFRLIALNNNDCYIYNWWIMYSIEDVKNQLQWLHDTLLTAERSNEKVHIILHVPTGDGSCFEFWSREYRRIIERFQKIIAAQFCGHTHFNEFNVFYDRNDINNPVNVMWNGGSLTTNFNVNPNYNVYHVDGNDFRVNDYEQWIFNLTEANRNSATGPRWYKQFSFKDNFKIPDLSISSLNNLLVSMTTVRSMARKYFQQKIKDGDPFLSAGCQDDCLRDHVCSITINEVGDDRRCKELLKNSFTSD